MSKAILALGAGIVIGAAGMWFFGKSTEKTLQVDEVIESYSTPMTTDSNTTPANPSTPADGNTGHVPPTSSNPAPLNLSDASNGNMDNVDAMNNMNNDANAPADMNNGTAADMNNGTADNKAQNTIDMNNGTDNVPAGDQAAPANQGGY